MHVNYSIAASRHTVMPQEKRTPRERREVSIGRIRVTHGQFIDRSTFICCGDDNQVIIQLGKNNLKVGFSKHTRTNTHKKTLPTLNLLQTNFNMCISCVFFCVLFCVFRPRPPLHHVLRHRSQCLTWAATANRWWSDGTPHIQPAGRAAARHAQAAAFHVPPVEAHSDRNSKMRVR